MEVMVNVMHVMDVVDVMDTRDARTDTSRHLGGCGYRSHCLHWLLMTSSIMAVQSG